MKKIIYSIVCISFFAISHAQSNDIQEANAFIKKVHDRVSQVKAAEFLVKRTYPLEKGQTSASVREIKGFFKVVPDDKATGYNYFIQFGDEKMMYDGKNSYGSSAYGGSLDIADTKKYPDQARLKFMSPNPFENLLDLFEDQYGKTAEKAETNFKDGMTVKISFETNAGIVYNVISYSLNYEANKNYKGTIYTTKDYLPVKLVTKFSGYDEENYTIENYTLLKNIPNTKFSVSLMDSYSVIYRYKGEENGYVEEEN